MNKAAQALGRMAKGKPKGFSKAELKLRAERMKKLNKTYTKAKRQDAWAKRQRTPRHARKAGEGKG